MRLVPVTEFWARKYLELFQERKLPEPWLSRMAILVAEGDELVMGVMAYDTSGPHLFFEHFVSNETATLRARHRAAELVAEQILELSRLMAKIPHVLIRSRGIDRMLRRVGFVATGAYSLICPLEKTERHDTTCPPTRLPQARRQGEPHAGPAEPGHAPDGARLPAQG